MTTRWMSRADWTKYGPVRPLAVAEPSKLEGLAIHWPGSTAPIGNPSASSIAARLEGYRIMHTSPGGLGVPTGGNDIAYNAAVDAAGRVWPLRGADHKSGANGSFDTNTRFGALLLMLGAGDHPSDAMLEAARAWRDREWLRRYPRAIKTIGHRDVYGTDCPGDIAYRYVKAGSFARHAGGVTPGEDDMTPEQIKDLVEKTSKATAAAVWAQKLDDPWTGDPIEASWALASGRFYAIQGGHEGITPAGASSEPNGQTVAKRVLDRLEALEAAVKALSEK